MAALFLAYIQSGDICYSKDWCRDLWDEINLLGEILLIIISVLPFSLFMFFFREQVFQAWWRFTRWFVPIIIIVSFLLDGSGDGGFGINSGAFNIVFIGFLYLVFIFISLIKIVRAHKRLKREEESQPGYQKDSGMTLAEGIAYHWKEWRK